MILSSYVILGSIIWGWLFVQLCRTVLSLPRLREQSADIDAPPKWPRLSIVIPACNEEQDIESALDSLLAQDYPELELIVVDDRSSDATGDIIDRMAMQDTRIKPIHIRTLPSGWLGKVHALHQGVRLAKGEWFLFSDADIHFADGALKRAMLYALHTHADHLSLLPRVTATSFWLGMTVRTFTLLFLYTMRASLVHKPDNEYYIGVGAFNLLRREVFERTPGFECLRLELGDDMALAKLMKQSGGNSRFALAREDLSLSWYPDMRAMFKGLEKNFFGLGAHFQWWQVVLQTFATWSLVVVPLVGLMTGLLLGQVLLLSAVIAVFLMHLVFILLIADKNSRDFAYLIFFPLGFLLVNAMMLRSAYCCLLQDGIDWRGTYYPLSMLRDGQRMRS